MPDPSFDVVSVVDMQEVRNAVDQARREIANRFDFKGTGTALELGDDSITIRSETEARLEAAYVVLTEKLVKRKVSLKALAPGDAQPSGTKGYRQEIALNQGIDRDRAREITKLVKDTKLKVQTQIQGDQLRVTGKKKDDLQAAMQAIRDADLPIPIQFTNYR